MTNGTVQSLWRYPVKSLLGESLLTLEINKRGVVGDRLYAITNQDGKFGSGKDTRRFRRIDGLFSLTAFTKDGKVWIRFPDKRVMPVGSALLNLRISHFLGQRLTVEVEAQIPHFDDGSVHILTTSSIKRLQEMVDGVDVRRFRPNLVLDCAISDPDLVGKKIQIGELLLEVTHQTVRCRMTTMAQGELKDNPKILKTLAKTSEANLGVYAKVIQGGVVSIGDEVVVHECP